MSDIFSMVDEYRNEFLNVLKQNKTYYGSAFQTYTTPSKKYKIDYYKWRHPYQGNWEYTETFTDGILDYLSSIIKPNSVVIDVGAQAGVVSVSYAQFAKKVISFEPNPAAYDILNDNTAIYKNIIPYNLACSIEEGELQFHYSDEGFCNGGFATACETGIGVTGHIIPMDVYAVNLNDFLNKYHKDDINDISLIKTDAEGHDKEIIKTIYPILKTIRPVLFSELYSGLTKVEIEDLINTVKNASYKIYDVSKNNSGLWNHSNRKEIKSIDDVIVGELCNLLCLPI